MAQGTPQAFRLRCSLAAFALLLLVMTTMASASQAGAQALEGTVRIVPGISSVAADRGPFTVFVVLEDLNHHGTLMYDDNRDTVPDREVESTGLAAFEFTIAYDQTVVELAGVEQGPSLGRSGRTFQCLPPAEEPGSISFGCLSMGSEPPGTQGTLTLASVTLRPVRSGSSPLLLEAVLAGPLGSDEVPVAVEGGVVRVTGRPAETATPAPAGTGPDAPGPEPGTTPIDTPAFVVAEGTPTAQSGPQGGRTPGSPTAVGDDEGPQDSALRGQDFEAENGGSAGGGGNSPARALLWSAGAAGGLVAVGALGLAAVVWRRRKRPGGA